MPLPQFHSAPMSNHRYIPHGEYISLNTTNMSSSSNSSLPSYTAKGSTSNSSNFHPHNANHTYNSNIPLHTVNGDITSKYTSMGGSMGLTQMPSSSNTSSSSSPTLAPHDSVQHSSQSTISQLRRTAKEIERELGDALDECGSWESSPHETATVSLRKVKSLLDQLVNVNQQLSTSLTESGGDPNQSGLKFHQDKLRYFTQAYNRINNAWEEKRQRDELFNHKAWDRNEDPRNVQNPSVSIAMKTMLGDSHSISSSTIVANSIISQGEEVRDVIIRGRKALEAATLRIRSSISQFSSIDSAMRIIQRAKVKHTVVIGIVIGLCLCIFLYMIL